MNRYIVIALLLSTTHQALPQLQQKLIDLQKSLNNLSVTVNAHKPAYQLPSWPQFVADNKKREQDAIKNKYPLFSGVVTVTADGKYVTLQKLHGLLESHNKNCVNFSPSAQMHMTLLYFNIPVEPSTFTDEKAMVAEIAQFIVPTLDLHTAALKPVTFTYDSTDVIGVSSLFLVANFIPTSGIKSIQDSFIIPFGTAILSKFPHAWISHIDNSAYHITFGKLQSHCSKTDIKMPPKMPTVNDFALHKGELKVSVKGPTSKPYWKVLNGW